MLASESALVVLVPEAEVAVKPFRDKYDPSAADGCPAHVTLLYPFKRPDQITETDLSNLGQCFASFSSFQFCLAVTCRFPDVIYLAPAPDEPFRQLTMAIWRRYPELPSYGGRHPDIVPHLSVAAQLADERAYERVATEFRLASEGQPPILSTMSDVALLDTRSGRWRKRATFKLR